MEYVCRKCHQSQPASAFYVKKAGLDLAWCRACYKAWYQARRDHHIKINSERKKIRFGRESVTFSCKQCGTAITRTVGINGNAKFCSRPCKDRHHKDYVIAARLVTKPARRCAWCGVDMPQSMRSDAAFCSETCNSRAHQSVRRFRRRAGVTSPRAGALPSFIDIAERDHWMCGICRKPVNKTRKFPDPLAGSIDHLLPVSCGGDHDPSNLQLAHFRCNWTKGSSAVNDQLRLLG